MNTNAEFERIVRDWLRDRAVEPAPALLATALQRVIETPQHRRRWLWRWFGRGRRAARDARDSGRRADTDVGRNRSMFTIPAAAAVLAALALITAFVVPGGDHGRPPMPAAEGGATMIVAADGSGEFSTISEAIAAATDGDTILVRPGEYAEALTIDRDVVLQGVGQPDEVVVSYPPDLVANQTDPEGAPYYATIQLLDSGATLGGLTVAGSTAEDDLIRAPILVAGGAPVIHDVSIVAGDDDRGPTFPFLIVEQARPVVQSSRWSGYVYSESGSAPTLVGNIIGDDLVSLNGPGEIVVRGNTFQGEGSGLSLSEKLTGVVERNTFSGGGVGIDSGSVIEVRDNTFGPATASTRLAVGDAESRPAIDVDGPYSDARVSDNSITAFPVGIAIGNSATATVEGNDLTDNEIGIGWSSTRSGSVAGNTVRGGAIGISVTAGAPSVTANDIGDTSDRGLMIGTTSSPTVEGNSVCDCGTNLWVAERSTPQLGENAICDEEPAG